MSKLLFTLLILFSAAAGAAQSVDPRSPILADEKPFPLPTDWGKQKVELDNTSLLDKNIIVAFYGNPTSTKMGILGEQGIEATADLLNKTAITWEAVSGDKKVIRAFHLIYGICYPDASIGLLSEAKTREYIDYAASQNMIVVLDHQLGKVGVEAAMKTLLPWLKFPNVHLALDPEWKTPNPGVDLGSISAADVNLAQQMMNDYLNSEKLPGKRMLILHQFHARALTQRDDVRTDFERVDLVHHADGFGPPALKLDTYKFLGTMKNMPVKGFKLFLQKPWKLKGMDIPMLTPAQVMALDPPPVYISYQ